MLNNLQLSEEIDSLTESELLDGMDVLSTNEDINEDKTDNNINTLTTLNNWMEWNFIH